MKNKWIPWFVFTIAMATLFSSTYFICNYLKLRKNSTPLGLAPFRVIFIFEDSWSTPIYLTLNYADRKITGTPISTVQFRSRAGSADLTRLFDETSLTRIQKTGTSDDVCHNFIETTTINQLLDNGTSVLLTTEGDGNEISFQHTTILSN